MFERVCQALGVCVVLTGILFAYTPLVNVWGKVGGVASNIQPADAVIALGSNIYPNGNLNNRSYRRTVTAVTLYRRGLAHTVVLLGAAVTAGGSEIRSRESLALDLGVPESDMVLESRGKTTQEEAELSRDILMPRGVRRVLVVTDSQHMSRAVRLFEKVGFEVFPATADDFPLPAEDSDDRIGIVDRVASEAVARAYHSIKDRWKP
jgi:uncharacterized SAM-binding protein YcdF (DUF218 family)